MEMESNLNFRGARVVQAVAVAAHHPTNIKSCQVSLCLKSLHRNNTLEVWMTCKEARELALQLEIMADKGEK